MLTWHWPWPQVESAMIWRLFWMRHGSLAGKSRLRRAVLLLQDQQKVSAHRVRFDFGFGTVRLPFNGSAREEQHRKRSLLC